MLGLAALLLAENVTSDHHYSSLSPADISSELFRDDQQTNSTSGETFVISSSSSWDAFVEPATSLYSNYHYSRDNELQHRQHHQQQPASNMATSILLSTAAFGGPWSRLLTSFIFLCTLLLLALLCFSLALVLMLAFRRLWSTYGKLSSGDGGHGGGRRKRRKELSMLEDNTSVCLKYSPTSAPSMIPPTWLTTHHQPPAPVITPYSTVQQQIQQQQPQQKQQQTQFPPLGKLTKASSSSQFYPAKCKEIAAISKKVRLSSLNDLTTSNSMHPDHIYMDIEARATTTTSTRESSREPLSLPLHLPMALPFPPPRLVNNNNNNNNNNSSLAPNNSPSSPQATTSCFITSIEDDHQVENEGVVVVSDPSRLATASAITTEQQCTAVYGNLLHHHHHHQLHHHHPHPSVRYYAVSMPWYNHQQQLLHQQILQQRIRPSLNISEANLRTAKASLKAPNHGHHHLHHHHPLPLPQTLSMMDSMSAGAMMDCYSSYSEVIMELKNKFNNNSNNNNNTIKAKQNKAEEEGL